ncbi:MAG: chorismate-binding protein, partial [Candidatus Omnitrophica bacterium]|nr:chorismate-binding protein [Candidatus Omnitrophota bacterium]
MKNSGVRPAFDEFLALSKRGNTVPVYRQILADFETPLSAYLKIEGRGPSYLLESVEQGERLGRYSFLGASPAWVLESRGREMQFISKKDNRRWTTGTDPLTELEHLMASYRAVGLPDLPRFAGGCVGYAGYDVVRFFEPVGGEKPDVLNVPDSVWMLSDTLVIFDHLEHVMKVVANATIPEGPSKTQPKRAQAAYKKAVAQIAAMIRQLKQPLWYSPPAAARKLKSGAVRSNVSRPAFLKAVRAAKGHIGKGDAIQIVLSQRFEVPVACPPFEVYRALRSINPSPYMFYLNFGAFALVGSSPEILVH